MSLLPAPACGPGSTCITCSDEGVQMRVSSHDADLGLAVCVDEQGVTREVETALVDPTGVGVGAVLLVHADVAIALLEGAAP